MPMLVLDRNVIRRPELAEAVADASNEFILTDTFFVEMVKHPELWETTLRKDVAELRKLDDRLWVSVSVDECLRNELQGRPITRDALLPPEFRAALDRLLHKEESIKDIADLLPALKAEQTPLDAPKERVEDSMRKLKSILGEEIIADLRSNTLRNDALLYFVREIAFRLYEVENVKNYQQTLPLLQSVVSRLYILRIWRAVTWLRRGGIEMAAPEKLHNDDYDDDYIIIGSFFDGVLSEDKGLNEAAAALRRIVDGASSDDLRGAYVEYESTRRC